MRAAVLLILVSLLGIGSHAGQDLQRLACGNPSEVRVTYLGNEGFLVSSAGTAVLIDALIDLEAARGTPPRPFSHPSRRVLSDMEAARPPFDNVDVVFVTHAHDDHFTAASVAKHLSNNRHAVLVAPPQVLEILGRDPESAETAGVPTIVVDTPHSGSGGSGHRAYLFCIGGHRLLHLGDARGSPADFERLSWLGQQQIDVAFVPHWLLTDQTSASLIADVIQADQVIAMHVNPWQRADVAEQLAEVERSGTLHRIHVFERELQEIVIGR